MDGQGGEVVDIRDLGVIPRILFATDGAINHILEAYASEAVIKATLSSEAITDESDRRELGITGDERAMRIVSLLRGRFSGRVFVHASAVVLLDRLPTLVDRAPLDEGATLLQVLTLNRVASFRETISGWEGTDEHIASYFGLGPSEVLVARTFRIVIGGRPQSWTTETFPKNGFSAPSPGPCPGKHRISLTRRSRT